MSAGQPSTGPTLFADPDELARCVGTRLGISPWRSVPQSQIDEFAEITGDHQWIHVDQLRAAASPLGTTIAHGFLLLALLPSLGADVFRLHESVTAVNAGFDKVRFVRPVRSGQRVRVAIDLLEVRETPTGIRIAVRSTIEVDETDHPLPAAIADMVFIAMWPDESDAATAESTNGGYV